MTNCLVITQYRNDSRYNDFLGKFYHFPGNKLKNYLNQFSELPIEFVYFEPLKNDGKGEFYGFGRITKKPFDDKRESGFYFIEIDDYKPFASPVSYKNKHGEVIEELLNPSYNYQNAVRKIPKNVLEEICLDGGIILNIKSDVHLIKVLGEQLIGSEKVGVLELIKNSIDAQATYCRVLIEKVKNLNLPLNEYEFKNYEGPVIVIDDDGVGMTKDIIENGWLRPASTLKTNIKEKLKVERENAQINGNLGSYDALIKKIQKEHGQRIPLGEKGVGRFATHRLGRYLELRTKTDQNPYELVLKIDWDKFDRISDKHVDLDSVGISLTREDPSRDYGSKNSGTRLIVFGGRDGFGWTEASILDLNRAILELNSPVPSDVFSRTIFDRFNAYLECPQITELPRHQIYAESKSNFSLDILVDENGFAEYELQFEHPSNKLPKQEWSEKGYDLKGLDLKNPNYWSLETESPRKPACGPFYVHMDVWYRNSEWIDLSDYKDLTDYLDSFGGMSIYRDNILVYDAQLGAQADWLGLAGKHIKQGWRISYRDFIGSIEIEQTKNWDLVDKTNREGLINNKAFNDLAVLTRNAIEQILLPRYTSKRDEFGHLTKGVISDPNMLNNLVKENQALLLNIGESNYPFDEDPYSFFKNLWNKVEDRKDSLVNLQGSMKNLEKSIKNLEEVQELFTEQAGFGISVAISLHEINKITSNFYQGILGLLKSKQYDELKLENLKTTSESLQSELKRLAPLRAIRNESNQEFKVCQSIKHVAGIHERKMEAENIRFTILNPNEDFQIFGRYRALNQIFGNLFDNSIYWIRSANKKENEIVVKLDKIYKTIVFADSGNDISDIIRPTLFQPGYSLRIPPSGLGLYICKSYLNGMKGRIYETPLKDRIPNISGAQLTIDFSKTPTNKENIK
ncbi:MAG: sensor histidine kinase [Bacteroidales bacterium]|nr:sensor histidine kinase [Bacteroidales bacterium]